MARTVKSWLQLSLKLFNLIIGVTGVAMILYSIWMVRAWQLDMDGSSSDDPKFSLPWYALFCWECLRSSMDFPEDPSRRFDDFDHFVKSNFDICKWIGWLLVLAQVWEAALQAEKDEEVIKPRQCEDLKNLVQESSNTEFARLEELKKKIENFNSSRSSNYVPYKVYCSTFLLSCSLNILFMPFDKKVKSSCVCFELPNSEVFITASLAFR
ncbi:hypothetical protein RHMOL_Rhmol02G0173100 [Rhododendron molle]|nr:hypothetical protein RHMOL_Rhmol02G0173100 [Rhododendron molle]